MPEKKTLERARRDKRQGKSASTQAGEFVREEMHHIREGKHGASSAKQAIAIGLSKARRAGVDLKPQTKGSVWRKLAAVPGVHIAKVSGMSRSQAAALRLAPKRFGMKAVLRLRIRLCHAKPILLRGGGVARTGAMLRKKRRGHGRGTERNFYRYFCRIGCNFFLVAAGQSFLSVIIAFLRES